MFELSMKCSANFYLLLMNIQCTTACSLEKVKFKVQIAVSLEPYQLFQQNLQNMLCENLHT